MTKYNKQKRQESLDYLKAKGMWVLDNKYTPTNSVNTDITKTFERARAEVIMEEPFMRDVAALMGAKLVKGSIMPIHGAGGVSNGGGGAGNPIAIGRGFAIGGGESFEKAYAEWNARSAVQGYDK